MKKCLFVFLFVFFGSANANIINVGAAANSSNGGIAAGNINLTAGHLYSINANFLDLWSAGLSQSLWSNANGLTTTPLYGLGVGIADANGDIPNVAITGIIGFDYGFGSFTQNGLSANYGSLVGQIDDGNFFKIGTSYAFTPSVAGTLKFYYLDINSGDNVGSIDVTVLDTSAVPEPATLALLGIGLAGMGFSRKKQAI